MAKGAQQKKQEAEATGAGGASPQQAKAGAESPPGGEPARPEIVRQINESVDRLEAASIAVEPLVGRLTPEQINQVLANEAHVWADRRFHKIVVLVLSILGMFLVGFLWITALAYGHAEIASDMAKTLGGVAAGLAGGYGIGAGVNRARRSPRPK
jgi:hypothetical protein